MGSGAFSAVLGGGDGALGGEVFAYQYTGAHTLLGNSISAPANNTAVVYGVAGAQDVGDWVGYVSSPNVSASAERPRIARDPDTGNVIVAVQQTLDALQIISSDGSTVLATLPGTFTSPTILKTAIFALSPAGDSIVWGPSYFEPIAPPTPDAANYVIPAALTVNKDNVYLVLHWEIGNDAVPQNPVLDLNGETTLTYGATGGSAGGSNSHKAIVVAQLNTLTGAVVDKVMNSSASGSNEVNWAPFSTDWTGIAPFDYPTGYHQGNPAVSPDGTAMALGITNDNINGGGVTPQLGYSSSSPLTIGINANGNHVFGGVARYDLEVATLPPEWAISQTEVFDTRMKSPVRASLAFDAAGALYWARPAAYISGSGTANRFPTTLSSALTMADGEFQIVKSAANGDTSWTARWTSTSGITVVPVGFLLRGDDAEVVVVARAVRNNIVVNVDPDGGGQNYTVQAGSIIVAVHNASTGAYLRSRHYAVRNSSDDNQGAVSGCMTVSPAFDTVTGNLKFAQWLDEAASPPLRVYEEGGTRTLVYNNTGGLDHVMLKYDIDPTFSAVATVTKFAEAAAGNVDDLVSWDWRAA